MRVSADPRPIKPFERNRPYVIEHDGREHVVILHVGEGYVLHPTS